MFNIYDFGITRSRDFGITRITNDYFLSKMSLRDPIELRAVVASYGR